ncbi:MAG TPA: response regulator transcription factor [Bacteroidales bacterium]|nr:response regulator transcription factor [Bacteroidales bacterium]HSA44303.1 response regulator transcription factor [Bacteroidales bacterium]
MIGILIVDDHRIVREGLIRIIRQEADMEVAGQARSAGEALKLLRSVQVDVIILDIALPGISGLEAIKNFKAMESSIKIIMLSMYPEERFAIRALKAGASGYLTKETAPEELINAIRVVYSGRNYITGFIAEKMLDELKHPMEQAPHERLSSREFEVMCMIGSGKTIKEIAETLSLSDRTVSTYRARILQKMNFKNNAMIVHYLLDNWLIE